MKMIKLSCPACAAPVSHEADSCEYCRIEFNAMVNGKIVKRLKDFGIKSKYFNLILLLGAITLYISGWIYEDLDYWLNNTAIFIWAGFLPLWLLLTNSIWQSRWGAILLGLLLSIIIFAVHVILMGYFNNWHFNDDYFAIAGLFAGISFVASFTGRGVHSIIRKALNKGL